MRSSQVLNELLAGGEKGGNEEQKHQELKEKVRTTSELRSLFKKEDEKYQATRELYKKLIFQLNSRKSVSQAILNDIENREKKNSRIAPYLCESYGKKIEALTQQEQDTYNQFLINLKGITELLASIKEQIDKPHQDNSYVGLYPLRKARLTSFNHQEKQYLKERKPVDDACRTVQQKIDVARKLEESKPVVSEEGLKPRG